VRSQKKSIAAKPNSPGAFLTDGSFFEAGEMHHRGHIDGLVRALVRQRREASLSLELACRAIRAANATKAFTCVAFWERAEEWSLVPCSTSAEEAVKREGRGADGHWCGQRWIEGRETKCSDPIHRTMGNPREVIQQLSSALGVSVDEDVPPPLE